MTFKSSRSSEVVSCTCLTLVEIFSSATNIVTTVTVVDPGGAAGVPPPLHGSRFFRFDIQIFRNVAASGLAPPTRSAPPTENPGSATELVQY